MSVKVMAAVWELDLPQNEKFLLLALADHADDQGFCFPSVARVAWKSGYSIRQVQAILKCLRGRYVLEIVGDQDGGRGHTTRYRVCPEKGAKIAPFVQFAEGRGPARERVKRSAERVRSSARKGEVATAPQSSGIVITEPSENHQGARAENRPSPVDDRFFTDLFERLKRDFHRLTRPQFDFGVLRVKKRAKTPPVSRSFWERSLPPFFVPETLVEETAKFLTEQAVGLLNGGNSFASTKEDLKRLAAEHDLTYTSGLVEQAIGHAESQVRHNASLRAELNVGALEPARPLARGGLR